MGEKKSANILQKQNQFQVPNETEEAPQNHNLTCMIEKSKVLCMKCYLECQGFPVKLIIIHQYITSSINMDKNGKESS